MESDEEDFVFYGTPIEREEDAASRKSKAVAEASGQLRTLPAWKQEVRDEEGRRRFHGAFTGGFSAGYFNSVGSKEGWAPQSFVSSRKSRAEVKQQSILNFLDEDEKTDLDGQSLGTSSKFDTFGFTAQELARKQADKEQQQRPSAIPGPAPDELILPATESIGVKLLLKMGWRRGRSIKESHANSISDSRREARKAFLAFSSSDTKSQTAGSESVVGDLKNCSEQLSTGDVPTSQSTKIYVLPPKQDVYGLGFDPYKNAPEFRERKRSRMGEKTDPRHKKTHSMQNNLFGFKSGNVAPGFGIGALEELDAEDEDVFASEYDFEETYVQEIDEPSTNGTVVDSKQKLITNEQGVLPGFRRASNAEYQPERFDPPLVPKDFVPRHKFPGPLENEVKVADAGPPDVSPPEDNNLKVLIDGVATLVARCGKLFEDLSREKNHSNPLFSFLLGGNGHDYYARKLWEARQKQPDQAKNEFDGKVLPSTKKLSAESRGNILGERPLERSTKEASTPVVSADSIQLQYNLSDTFMKPASLNKPLEISKPFNVDPVKQERFERFLKQKYEGGLRTTGFGGSSNMSEADRARERLDFEAAAEAMEKQNWGKEINNSTQHITDYLASGAMQFTSGGLQKAEGSHAEDSMKKKMYPKREEFQWRPAPVLCKRFDLIDPYMGKPPPAPRIRSKIDTLIFTADSVKAKSIDGAKTEISFAKPQSDTRELRIEEAEKEVETYVQVENVERPVDLYKAIFSDDSEDEASDIKNADQQEKKAEAANTALSRLMAGDFLESLGKELGLEVPPDPPYSSTTKSVVASSPEKHDFIDKPISSTLVNNQPSSEKTRDTDRKVRTRHQSSSSDSSSEDEERRGKQSRRHRRRSSDDSDGGDRSRSKRKREREKSSRDKKHHKHRHRDRESRASPSKSRHSESRRDKHKKRS